MGGRLFDLDEIPEMPPGLALACHADGRETHPSTMTWMLYCNCVRCCRARAQSPRLAHAGLVGGMVAVKV